MTENTFLSLLCLSGEVLEAKQNRFPESSFPPLVPRSLSSPKGAVEKEAAETRLSDSMRRTKVSDDFMKNVDQQARKVETYIIGLIQRRASPTRPSKPRTSLAHDGKAVTVVRQSSLCHKEEQYSSKLVSIQEMSGPPQWSEGTTPQTCPNLDQERDLGTGFTEGAPLLYHNHLQQSVKHQPGLYHRPRQASMMNTSCSIALDYPSFRVLQVQPESSNSEPGSPQHFHKYPSPPLLSKPYQQASPEDQLVSAEYIPAQPCRASTRAYAHHHSSPQKGSFMPKPNKSTYSPKRDHHHHQEQQPTASQSQPSRSRGGIKKCRSNDDRSSVSRKPGKKACRSQSENSLQRVPERRYDTAEREGGASGGGGKGRHNCQSRSKKQQHGGGSCRRWQSTQELSQDEADQPPVQSSAASNQKESCGKRTRKTRPTHAAYAYSHHHYQHHQHMDYQFERDQVSLCQPTEDYPHPGQGESESSLSEADSPDSSSLSSDSDESGSLVWPQQLSPQPSLPSPPVPPGVPLQSKAFVKIKASHALKKKILRFRTGSLKVMTTV